MTSHDLPVEEIQRLLKKDKEQTHVHVYDNEHFSWDYSRVWMSCDCGEWEKP